MQTQIGENDRTWAIYANAAGLLAFTNIPFANVVGPLLIWLKVRNDPAMPFAREHARTALNFQITWSLIFMLVVGIFVDLAFTTRGWIAMAPLVIWPLLGGALLLLLVNVVLCILGCLRASDLRAFANPIAFPFVR